MPSKFPEVRIVDEIRKCMAEMTRMGTRCCELVADYMDLFPHKTDKKRMVPMLADELGVSESRVHQWWRAGLVKHALPASTIVPGGESQLRPLVPLLKRGDEVVIQAWCAAKVIAEDEGEELTAEHVAEAADKYKPLMQGTKKEPSDYTKIRSWIRQLRKISGEMNKDKKFIAHEGKILHVVGSLEAAIA